MHAADGEPAGPYGLSEVGQHFMAGMMKLSRELAVFIAPFINSYKRYASLSWAPVNVVWGRDNRTTGFRLVGRGPGLHVEDRFPGGDMNAYLTYAAMMGAGLYGIEHELPLDPEFKGNGYLATGVAADAARAVRGDLGAGALRGRGRDLRPGRRRPLPQRGPRRAGDVRLGRPPLGPRALPRARLRPGRPAVHRALSLGRRPRVAGARRRRGRPPRRCRPGCRPLRVRAVGSAPADRNSSTSSSSPCCAAAWSGVNSWRWRRVDVGAGRDQDPADLVVAAGRRAVQRLDLELVARVGVDLGAGVEQGPGRLGLAEERREMERREPVGRERRRRASGPRPAARAAGRCSRARSPRRRRGRGRPPAARRSSSRSNR